MFRRVPVRLLVAAIAALVCVVLPAVAPAQASAEELTVHMYRVQEVACDEEPGESCPDDYYPLFILDGKTFGDDGEQDHKDFCCEDQTDFRTNWVRSVEVP